MAGEKAVVIDWRGVLPMVTGQGVEEVAGGVPEAQQMAIGPQRGGKDVGLGPPAGVGTKVLKPIARCKQQDEVDRDGGGGRAGKAWVPLQAGCERTAVV